MRGRDRAHGDLEAEVVSEEPAEPGSEDEVRSLPAQPAPAASPALRSEVRTAAIVAAGGALAGAATVAAMRAVGASSGRRPLVRRGRRTKPANVVASRSFLVDVHLLDR